MFVDVLETALVEILVLVLVDILLDVLDETFDEVEKVDTALDDTLRKFENVTHVRIVDVVEVVVEHVDIHVVVIDELDVAQREMLNS